MKKSERPAWDKKTQFPSLVTYASEKAIKAILAEKSDQLDFAEYIYHDKDNKEPHYHVVLHLKQPRYVSDIIAWFKRCVDDKGEFVNTMGEPARSTEDMDNYLRHTNDQTKHQYTEEDIKVSFGSREAYRQLKTEYQVISDENARREYAKEANADDVEKQLQDIIDGVSYREMARRYGRDYIKNCTLYRNYALAVAVEETGLIPEHLIADPLQNLINKQVRQATDYGVEHTTSALVALYEKAMLECNLERSKIEQIGKKIQKYITKE